MTTAAENEQRANRLRLFGPRGRTSGKCHDQAEAQTDDSREAVRQESVELSAAARVSLMPRIQAGTMRG